jgi:AraC-like DNA-binding protein
MPDLVQYSKIVRSAVAAVKVHIDLQPARYKTCEELLASLTTVNRNLLEKGFKDTYGFGMKEYMVKQRLKLAKQLLETDMTKKNVAAKCLYASQSAFCTAFRKEFGITPTEWQNRCE